MSQYVFRVQCGNMHPVLDGFIHITLIEEKVCGSRCRFNRCFEVTCAFEKLRKFFHRNRICGRDLRNAFIDLQRFFKVALLE